MDSRLFRVDGRRILRLRREDLPELARAIIAVVRRRARAGVFRVSDVGVVELQGLGVSVLVHGTDWQRILPYVQDESFNTQLNPAGPSVGYLDPDIAYGEPILDRADLQLYNRIYGILRGLFTETYPTRPF